MVVGARSVKRIQSKTPADNLISFLILENMWKFEKFTTPEQLLSVHHLIRIRVKNLFPIWHCVSFNGNDCHANCRGDNRNRKYYRLACRVLHQPSMHLSDYQLQLTISVCSFTRFNSQQFKSGLRWRKWNFSYLREPRRWEVTFSFECPLTVFIRVPSVKVCNGNKTVQSSRLYYSSHCGGKFTNFGRQRKLQT